MVQKIGPEENSVTFKFGGGLHTRASPDEIDGHEAAAGGNFTIDIQNRNLRARAPFDLIGTVPNGLAIRGAGSLLTTGGVVTTLFQAGNKVYQWTPPSTFTQVGICSSTCKLRGHWREHVWNLSDVVLFTDLNLSDGIYQWDGTTFSSVTFTNEGGGAFGTFKAKFLSIINERAVFANVQDNSQLLPHLMVGSTLDNYTQISVVNRPSDSLGPSDPFYIPMQDLKPVNGLIASFLGTMLSTEQGSIWNLNGSDSSDFSLANFYAHSNAVGYESLCEIGNDFIYGRQGRIESVRDTNTYGNSESADVSALVQDQMNSYNAWTVVFNSRTRIAYLFPTGGSECWVLDCAIRDQTSLAIAGALSPWMRYTTSHALAFQPTLAISLLDPSDGLEYIFMGDGSGNIYRMEGTGAGGDGGANSIDMQFLSLLVPSRLDTKINSVEGYVKYQQQTTPSTLTLTFQFQGENIFNEQVTVALAAAGSGNFYSGAGSYYSKSGVVYNSFEGKMTRNRFSVPGHANEFQCLVEVSGVNPVSINEIGLRFRGSSQ